MIIGLIIFTLKYLNKMFNELKNKVRDNVIELSLSIRIKCNSLVGETELTKLYMKGKSLKVSDIWDNEYSFFTLSKDIQNKIIETIQK